MCCWTMPCFQTAVRFGSQYVFLFFDLIRSISQDQWGSSLVYALFQCCCVGAKSRIELIAWLDIWIKTIIEKGLRIKIVKTKYLCYNFSGVLNAEGVDIIIWDQFLFPKEISKYLGSMMHKGRVEVNIIHRINACWLN